MVSSNFVLAVVATLASPALSYPTYSAKIPNGMSFGKQLGHKSMGYTSFGKLFRDNGNSWAGVCKLPWPDQSSITVGAALGDPCCSWTGGSPDFSLSAPNPSGTVCASGGANGGSSPAVGNGAVNAGGSPPTGNGASQFAQSTPAFRGDTPMAAPANNQGSSMLQQMIAALFKKFK